MISESTFGRRLAYIVLPFLTLAFGWHLGRIYQLRAPELSLVDDTPSATGSQLVDTRAGTGGIVFTNPEKQADLSILWETWNALNDSYIDPTKLGGKTLVLGAAKGLVQAVGDPYTIFMTPTESKQFSQAMEGALDGIGAQLKDNDGAITIVAPLKNSPAEKAGLKAGDVIDQVNGEHIQGLGVEDVVQRIRGKSGTTVTLKIYHTDSPTPQTLSIVREHITIPSTESEIKTYKGKTIGHLTLNQFGDNTISEVRDILRDFKLKNVDGIVLDLRYNGGGYLDGAVDLVSMFLKEGRIVTVARRGGNDESIDVTGDTVFPDLPLVVLMNEASASASEITAGALQDHKRATVIGVKSFGKGTVQDVLPLSGGASLRVTIAHWLTPNGKNLAKEGIDPDIKVENTDADLKAEKDPQLDAALAWLVDKKDVTNK